MRKYLDFDGAMVAIEVAATQEALKEAVEKVYWGALNKTQRDDLAGKINQRDKELADTRRKAAIDAANDKEVGEVNQLQSQIHALLKAGLSQGIG